MKILQVYEIGPTGIGCIDGLGIHIMEISKRLVKHGHEVAFLTGQTSPKSPSEEEIEGIRVIRRDFLGLMQRFWSPVQLKLSRQAAFAAISQNFGEKFDIYIGHYYTSGLAAYALAKKAGGTFFNVIHGSHLQFWKTSEMSRLKAGAYITGERLLTPLLARLSRRQIHTAEYSAKLAREWGAPQNKLMTIYNGVDVEKFNPNVKPAIPSKNPIIFTARRLVKKNGLHILIKAMKQVLNREEAKLVIAGQGPEKQALQSLAEALNISKDIIFLGALPHSLMPEYIASATIVAIPSYVEASSLFMLEAMAMEKPIIASNTGGMSEILTHNQTGILVTPGNHQQLAAEILRLLKNHKLCSALGKAARETVLKNFTWEITTQKYLSEFKHAIEHVQGVRY